MVDIIENTQPSKVIAGETWKWSVKIEGYNPSEWGLSFIMINGSQKYSINTSANADNTGFEVNENKTITSDRIAGKYTLFAYATKDDERISLWNSEIEIIPNIFNVSTYDSRTEKEKTLDAIEATLQGKATKDQQEYSIAGRTLKRIPIPELLQLRKLLKAEIAAEKKAEALKAGVSNKGNRLLVRFK